METNEIVMDEARKLNREMDSAMIRPNVYDAPKAKLREWTSRAQELLGAAEKGRLESNESRGHVSRETLGYVIEVYEQTDKAQHF